MRQIIKNGTYIIFFIIIVGSGSTHLFANQDNILLNLQLGHHYDVGNLRSLNNSGIRPQLSTSIGISYKADLRFFFIQLGLNKSILISEGKIYNNSADQLKSVSINYYSAPMFCGLNFPLTRHSKLFIGAGIVYFLTDGTIKTTNDRQSFDKIIFARAITVGIQHRFKNDFGIIFQWDIITANSSAVADTDSSNTWKNFDIDLSGNKFNLGITYYIK